MEVVEEDGGGGGWYTWLNVVQFEPMRNRNFKVYEIKLATNITIVIRTKKVINKNND